MRRIEELRITSKRNIQIADHMIYMTYNVVKDPKILLSIMDNIFLGFSKAMNAVLQAEYIYKKIPSIPKGFEAKSMLFRDIALKYDINDEYLKAMREIKETIIDHKTSPVEFRRKDKFVICSGDYKMRTIDIDIIKKYIKLAKEFISKTDSIIIKNVGIH
tara:strand:+ start:1182 stop:1661 length:480 start_codon:yes stop_codon:yes gene_type:complete